MTRLIAEVPFHRMLNANFPGLQKLTSNVSSETGLINLVAGK
jgi:hypothetical protein